MRLSTLSAVVLALSGYVYACVDSGEFCETSGDCCGNQLCFKTGTGTAAGKVP
ncbi:hypothetical protein EXIGLDRAFT_736558 [Exidia glandulosa HHB12029]|uniref:Uncharacterized protein n=1 Tax=Exidia glandulosa HHB12029 TaxID=1314781 RepID=A0A165JD46_EXIGL|nr:hypothetical protein EXIGLDRAFT_736558 [Exidia glandulosa HHB12029]